MIAAAKLRVEQFGLKNVVVERRDFVMDGCGRKPESAGVALFFNILHIENPVGLFWRLTEPCSREVWSASSIGFTMNEHLADPPSPSDRDQNNVGRGASKLGCGGFAMCHSCQARLGTGVWF